MNMMPGKPMQLRLHAGIPLLPLLVLVDMIADTYEARDAQTKEEKGRPPVPLLISARREDVPAVPNNEGGREELEKPTRYGTQERKG